MFSALDAISSQYALKYGVMLTLSNQELVDCSSPYGNQGCSGGAMANGMAIFYFQDKFFQFFKIIKKFLKFIDILGVLEEFC